MKFTPFYQFAVAKKVEKEVQKTKIIDEKEIKVLEKEISEEPVSILFKKPGRRDEEEADLFYAKKVNYFVKEGLLTRAMLSNKYKDSGGFVSDETVKEYSKLVVRYLEIEREIVELKSTKKGAKNKEKIETLEEEYASTQKKIVDLQTYQDSLMSQTADDKAQNELLKWFALNFFYVQKDEEDEPKRYFSGETYEDRLENYYEKEDSDDEFHKQASAKIANVVALWFFRRSKTPEEFEELMKQIDSTKSE